MLLALGPTLIDAHRRAVVVALLDLSDGELRVAGADAVWLRGPTADEVTEVARRAGVPVGVTADDLSALRELIAAGAAAIECDAPGAAEVAAAEGLVLWCSTSRAAGAVAAGVRPEHLVVEGAQGITVAGEGPPAWGAVVRGVRGGARVIRTTDVRSVRRVVTVTERLVAARARRQDASA